ncbi:substrate-binding domain-containing protein, partial [Mycobacterium tuberculosis]|nr:substrate-binding domain-containing protein [Mycobacterium tuberculosis]
IAIIVNSKNPVQNLTLDQIAGVFAGKITNWRDLGGEARPIRVLRRSDDIGATALFRAAVLDRRRLNFDRNAQELGSMES